MQIRVRVGERVRFRHHGDVMEIGMGRLNMVELGGSGHYISPPAGGGLLQFHFFQPTASCLKQIPGTILSVWWQKSGSPSRGGATSNKLRRG